MKKEGVLFGVAVTAIYKYGLATRQKIIFELLFFFLFMLPLTLILWRHDVIKTIAKLLWKNVILNFLHLFWVFLKYASTGNL